MGGLVTLVTIDRTLDSHSRASILHGKASNLFKKSIQGLIAQFWISIKLSSGSRAYRTAKNTASP